MARESWDEVKETTIHSCNILSEEQKCVITAMNDCQIDKAVCKVEAIVDDSVERFSSLFIPDQSASAIQHPAEAFGDISSQLLSISDYLRVMEHVLVEEICEEIQETEEKQAADQDHAKNDEAPCMDILGDNPDHKSESEISKDDRNKMRVVEKCLSAFNKFLCC